ncbi:MAG: fructose-1,6-bisphosphatase [Eubacteriaceae bacterium]|nr:fructose-1,6-bisphosphatase [Eubacteriaceae bacterium]
MSSFYEGFEDRKLEFLALLSENYKNSIECSSELVRLRALLKLPKGTEHFLSDLHGEYDAFEKVIRTCSGNIFRRTVEAIGPDTRAEFRFDTIAEAEEFCEMVYYPEETLASYHRKGIACPAFYRLAIFRLLKIFEVFARKYAQSAIIEKITPQFSFIIRELVFKNPNQSDRETFYAEILDGIIETGFADSVIAELCAAIKKLCVERLHIVGDIFDRGREPHYIIDSLIAYHAVDIQWGNHDILWLGAAAGNLACIANAVRICLRYANTSILETGYGINFYPLLQFAEERYELSVEELQRFMPITSDEVSDIKSTTLAKMHKAISIIQFKLESQLIKRNPGYNMENRMILDTIDTNSWTAQLGGKEYKLNSRDFPTVLEAGMQLTSEEASVIESLRLSFTLSEKLQRHAQFLLSHGSIYLVYNKNLLIHAGVPVNREMGLSEVAIEGQMLKGKELLDAVDQLVRKVYSDESDENKDFYWYLWCSPESPLFGKDKMATFERYFFDDTATHAESTQLFYEFIDEEELADRVLREFGLEPGRSHIICGHVPVKAFESAIKANRKILCIDLGYAKAYQKETGGAGCSLIYNSIGLTLMKLEPKYTNGLLSLSSTYENIEDLGIENRLYVADTEQGKQIKRDIENLELLLQAYRTGSLPEREH